MVAALALPACGTPDLPAGAHGSTQAGAGAPSTGASLWVDVTETLLDSTAEWSSKVELADLDGDGMVELLFANGGGYSTPGDAERNRAFTLGAEGRFVEVTPLVFGSVSDYTRVVEARDFDGDALVDVFVGNTYQTRSRLLLAEGEGRFRDRSRTHLPGLAASVGDAEAGDVDGDGDLDLVLVDWGAGDAMRNEGGRTLLWLNDGAGRFRDATDDRMPDVRIRFSWDLEVVDVDNDLDLDILISCKRCAGSTLFRNDGSGRFEEDRRALPRYTNNYELEAMDLDGDGYLDLVTVNDGDIVEGVGSSRREHVFQNDGEGRFRDRSDVWWPDEENPGFDDNVAAYLDYDSDGDADVLIGSLSGPDRLMVNDGLGRDGGRLRVVLDAFTGAETPGTLGMSIADVDGDGRVDVVQSQGEHPTAVQERIFSGRGLPDDTQPPVVDLVTLEAAGDGDVIVRCRVHDRKSPMLPSDWRSVEVEYEVMDAPASAPMRWYGGYLWRSTVPGEAANIRVCATDRAGNRRCVSGSPG